MPTKQQIDDLDRRMTELLNMATLLHMEAQLGLVPVRCAIGFCRHKDHRAAIRFVRYIA